MARIQRRRMFWTDPVATDLVKIEVYAGKTSDFPTMDSFIAAIEGDSIPFHAEVDAGVGEYYLANLEETEYHLAIAGRDDDGNHSDAVFAPEWVAVPLDVTPPDAPVPGGLD